MAIKRLLVCITVCVACTTADAQVAALLSWGAGARSLGMGRAGAAVCADVSGSFYNPAQLVRLEKFEFLGSYATLYEDTGFGFLGVANPSERAGCYSLSVMNIATGGLLRRDETGRSLGGADYSTLGATVSGAWSLDRFVPSDYVSVAAGINGRLFQMHLVDTDGQAFTADAGALAVVYFSNYRLNLGISCINIANPLMTLATGEVVPFILRFGTGLSIYDDAVVIAADMLNMRGAYEFAVGVEFNPWKTLGVRAGFNDREFTLGVGLTQGDMQINYAMLINRSWNDISLGLVHTIDVKIKMVLFKG